MKPRRILPQLTEAEKESIKSLFFRTELRGDEDVVDNETKTIARELGVDFERVDDYIDELINNLKIG